MTVGEAGYRQPAGAAVALLAIAVNTTLFVGVAIASGYPILFFDTFSYIDGAIEMAAFAQSVFRRLFDATTTLQWAGSSRSKPYELFLVGTGGIHSPWSPVIVVAIANAWLVWVTVRHLLLRPPALWAIGLGIALTALTSLPWVASMLMPDALTAPLILAAALLATGAARGSIATAIGLALIVAVGVSVHPSHVLLGCALVAVLLALRLPAGPWRGTVRPWLAIGAVFVGWGGLVLLGFALLGNVSLTGTRTIYPFVLSRFIADGPVRRYLAEHCGRENWALCPYQEMLTSDSDDLLFNRKRPWWSADDGGALRRRIWREQGPLLIATFKTRGGEMVAAFLGNGARQLVATRPEIFSFSESAYNFAELPGAGSLVRTRTDIYDKAVSGFQRRAEPEAAIQGGLLVATEAIGLLVLLCIGFFPSLRARVAQGTDGRFLPFALILVAGIIANAWITGGLSGVFARYQARVAWLLPFAAMLAGSVLWSVRRDRGRGEVKIA